MKMRQRVIVLAILAMAMHFLADGVFASSKMPGPARPLKDRAVQWHEGPARRHAWLSLEEAVLFLERDGRAGEHARASLKSSFPGAVITGEQGRLLTVRVGRSSDLSEHGALIRTLRNIKGVRSANPVFYSSPSASPGSRMILTGQVIVQFPARTSSATIRAVEDRYGLKLLRALPYAGTAFVYDTGDPFRGLAVVDDLARTRQVISVCPDWIRTLARRAVPDDTLFNDQWHLRNTGQGGGTAGEDVNIMSVWDTLRGSDQEIIAIVDDGLETGHPDLAANVRTDLCWDFVDNEADTTDGDHGTSCAGVAAARGFNAVGVSGAAPTARLAGHRILGSGGVTDSAMADALTRNNSAIDIFSNSWGPYDGGHLLDGPSSIISAALASGASAGRGGLGTIFLWAGGNGYDTDNSNYDGYANSRYVIAVAASTNYGTRSPYSERGANILVNAPSSGGSRGITTTDRTGTAGYGSGNYTSSFGGTSSATPLVAGVTALMLQANPALTWRDVRAILATTARKNDPSDPGWVTNSAGHLINDKYGFGRVDAQAAVSMAQSWTTLAAEVSAQATSSPNLAIPDNSPAGISDTITLDSGISIEYVEVSFSAANHTYWPDLEVTLVSPDGTQSVLAERHSPASGISGRYDAWRFGSVRHLGENSRGTWTLLVRDLAAMDTGTFQSWTLTVYGTPAARDTTAPAITDVTVSNLTDTTATITWTTDEPSDSTVRYGTESSSWQDYPSSAHSGTLTTSHSLTLGGLTDATTFFFRVGSTDADGNGPELNGNASNPSDEMSFSTPSEAPVISNVAVSRTSSSATITWTTDEPAGSHVQYGRESSSWGSYPSTASDATLTTNHRIRISGLTGSTLFYFRVGSRDAAGNGPDQNANETNPSPEGLFRTMASQTSTGTSSGTGSSTTTSPTSPSQTDTSQTTSSLPTPPQVMEVHPHDGAGVTDNSRIPANASFAARVSDSDGIDLTDAGSIVLHVDDGINAPYSLKLDDVDVIRTVKLNADTDTAARSFWVVYDRSRDTALGDFPFGHTVVVTFQARDRRGYRTNERSYSFRVETEQEHLLAARNTPTVRELRADDPLLRNPQETGFMVTRGPLAGTRVIHAMDEPVPPELGPLDEIGAIDIEGVYPVGEVLNLMLPTIFSTPVRIYIPCPGVTDLSQAAVYLNNGSGWVMACDGQGTVQPEAVGWMVEDSRVDHPETSPPTVEISVYHFTAVQAGSTLEPETPAAPSGGGGGGCFIGTAGLNKTYRPIRPGAL